MAVGGIPDFSRWVEDQAKLVAVWADGVRRMASSSGRTGDEGVQTAPVSSSLPWGDAARCYLEVLSAAFSSLGTAPAGPGNSAPSAEAGHDGVPRDRGLKELQAFWAAWAQLALETQESALAAWSAGAERGPHRGVAELVDATFGKILGAPGLGYTRELQEKSAEALAAWTELWRSQGEYATELSRAAERSLEIFEADLAERKRRGDVIEACGDLLGVWSEAAEQGYSSVARTSSFAEAQARLTNTAMKYRVRSRALAEEFYRAAGLPTMTDLEESFRCLHEVRRRLRAVEREVASLRGELEQARSGGAEARSSGSAGGRRPRARKPESGGRPRGAPEEA